jgi:hypothetical protein
MPLHTQTLDPAGIPAQSTIERRSAPRYRCCAECTVRPENATGIGLWHGIVYNISTTGIGMALPCPVNPGTVLVIEPWRWGQDRRLRARVVRSVPVSFLFFHGCEFLEPLTEAELGALLK